MASSRSPKIVPLQPRESCPAYGQAHRLLREGSRMTEGYCVRGVYVSRRELAKRVSNSK